MPAVNVVSQPVGVGRPALPSSTRQSAPRAVSAIEELVVLAERQAVRDDPLRRRRSAAAGGCKRLVLTPDADRVGHRRDAEEHRRRAARRADAEDAPLGGAAVGDVEVAVAVEGDAVRAGRPGCEARRDRRVAGSASLGVTTPISSPAAPKPVR